MSSPAELAVDLAEAGYSVFPIWGIRSNMTCECPDGAECDSPGKHPLSRYVPKGLHDASDDPVRVAGWWRQHPSANVGLVTGGPFFVLDADGDQGIENVGKLFDSLGIERRTLDAIPCVRTGGGGRHWYFAKDEDIPVRNRVSITVAGVRYAGVDVRGDGGYVVVPPSRHASGGVYEWIVELDELCAAPHQLLGIVAGAAEPAPRKRDASPVAIAPHQSVPRQTVEEIKAALTWIDPACDYETWVERVLMPIHEFFGGHEEGLEIVTEWSARAAGRSTPSGKPAYSGPESVRRKWRSFKADHPDPKGIATFFELATNAGYAGLNLGTGIAPPAGLVAAAAAPSSPPPASNGAPPAPTVGPAWADPEALPVSSATPGSLDFDRAWIPELGWLRDFVSAIARLQQVPVEFPALVALGLISGSYGRVYRIKVGKSGWREEPPLWIMCVLPSGGGKSPVFRSLVAPFRAWDAATTKEDAEGLGKWEARLTALRGVYAARQREVQKAAAKPDFSHGQLQVLEGSLESAAVKVVQAEDERPPGRAVLVSDLTTPALVRYLQEHQGRAILVDPEGSVFGRVLGGRSDHDKEVDPWCKAFSGEMIKQTRIGDSRSKDSRERYVAHPNLAVVLATQHPGLSLYRDDYAVQKGFTVRFIPAVLPPTRQTLALLESDVPADLAEAWRVRTWQLLAREIPKEPADVVLEGAGLEAFKGWIQGWLDRDNEQGVAHDDFGYQSATGAKLRSFALRIVLAFHVLAHDRPTEVPVSADLVRTVLDVWMPFVVECVHGTTRAAQDDLDLQIASRILAFVVRKELDGGFFSRTDAYHNLKSRSTHAATVSSPDDLNAALALLVDLGYLKPLGKVEARFGSTPAASKYSVHPKLSSFV